MLDEVLSSANTTMIVFIIFGILSIIAASIGLIALIRLTYDEGCNFNICSLYFCFVSGSVFGVTLVVISIHFLRYAG
jgi:hypothetical protein